MGCRNCNFTGRVALTNNDGQVYEYRKCPECTCKACDGAQFVWTDAPDGLRLRKVPCYLCRPDRFDAHVRLFRRLARVDIKLLIDPCSISVTGNHVTAERALDPRLDHSKEFYESVYRGCLNRFERFARWITHNKNGSKR